MVLIFAAAMFKDINTEAQVILFIIGIVPVVNTAILLAGCVAALCERAEK